MKFFFLLVFALLVGFVNHEVFPDTEMTGLLRIMDSYSTDVGPHPYLLWFTPDGQSSSYRLDASTISSSVLDWSGERVKITVPGNSQPLARSSNQGEQFLEITSIQLIKKPLQNSPLQLPAAVRSVTLLSKYSDIATTPQEDPNTGPGQFDKPQGVAVDNAGNIYVADSFNHRIQKFNATGFFLQKFGTVGTGNGQFKFPSGVAVDTSGNIYVVDNNNHRVQKFDSNGVFLLKFGTNGGDGTSGTGAGQFNLPFGIAVDSSANIYVADTGNHRIQKFNSAGVFQTQFGSFGNGDGQFNAPRGITVDSSGNIFVADTGNNRIQKFDSNAGFLMKFGTSGSENGNFSAPRGIAMDSSNNIYVADTGNNRIQKFDSVGGFLLQFGTLGAGDTNFNSPEGIAVGSILVGDKTNNRILKFDNNGNFQSKIGYTGSLIHDQAYFKGIFYDNPGSLKNYYLTSSYGKFIWNGDVSGWNTLPQPKATYASNPIDFDKMITDSIMIHESNVNFCNPTPVTNLILIFNGPVSPSTNSAFGSLNSWPNPQNGGVWPTADGCNLTISVSWEPDNGGFFCCGQTLDRGIGVTAHELGHNLGLLHTPPPPGAWRESPNPSYTDPYHDPNSVMSNNRDLEGPAPLIAGQRDQAAWMDAGNKATVTDGTSATITLDFINEPEGGVNKQMITVPLPGGGSYVISGHNEGLFSDTPQDRAGAIMYRYFPAGNQYTYLPEGAQSDRIAQYSLVATAGTNSESQFDEAMLEVNETFVDNVNNITVTTLSKTATTVTVFVSNNVSNLCSPSAGVDWTISSSCTLTQNVTADKNIIIQNSSKLTIPNGKTLFFNSDLYNITIKPGSGILIQSGGSIKSSP